MFRASSCLSSEEWYKIDSAYGVQHWEWFHVVKPFPTSAHQPPLLHDSSAKQPVLYTIGAVDFVPFS
jgi:predicted nucleotidyltransferase